MTSRLVRLLKWLWSDVKPEPGHCPLWGREVDVAPNSMPGRWSANIRIPRPVRELVGACLAQNGTAHTEAEIAAAAAERPWR